MQLIENVIIAEQRMFDAMNNVEQSKVGEILPFLRIVEKQSNLNLKYKNDFKTATEILIISTYLN